MLDNKMLSLNEAILIEKAKQEEKAIRQQIEKLTQIDADK